MQLCLKKRKNESENDEGGLLYENVTKLGRLSVIMKMKIMVHSHHQNENNVSHHENQDDNLQAGSQSRSLRSIQQHSFCSHR